jgi:hypothetical protein
MSWKRIVCETKYFCPVCNEVFSKILDAEKHFKRCHQIKGEKVYHCNICGAGWYAGAYGDVEAASKAEKCYQKHLAERNADEIAMQTYCLSEKRFGYATVIKGGAN